MTQHIEIVSTASRFGADVRQLVTATQRVQDDFRQLKAIMDQVVNTDDWAALAAKLGTTVPEAQTFATLLNSARLRVNHADIDAFLSRLG